MGEFIDRINSTLGIRAKFVLTFSLPLIIVAAAQAHKSPGQTRLAPIPAMSRHWAFRSPVKPIIPAVENRKSKIENPIDAFLLAALAKKRLAFSPEADRRTLIRRLTYDLIGLPPTPKEVEEFVADRRPDAYARVVDRLLADPRYGERWARHWLDVAGYADSEGILQEDLIRSNAYRYRDYVIKSFNDDKPYNRFLLEQIAGDELYDYRTAEKFTPEIEEALVATGYLRTAVDATRSDFNTHQFTEYQYRMLNDTEMILASSVLGITLQCARCHNHKYEPFKQRDYYAVQAIFAGAIRPEGKLLPSRLRQVVAATVADQNHAKVINAAVDASVAEIGAKQATLLQEFRLKYLDAHFAKVAEADRETLRAAVLLEETKRSAKQKLIVLNYKDAAEPSPEVLSSTYPEFKSRTAELRENEQVEKRRKVTLPDIRALYDQDGAPPPTHILARGEWTKKLDPVEPGIPAVLEDRRHPFNLPKPAAGAATTGRRKALADWLVRPDNPLTARVIVNRIWAHHFGVGLVPTVENFGHSGARPTNQALLDWLAVELTGSNGVFEEGSNGKLNTHLLQYSATPLRPWSLKSLHRLIVTSKAYRQSSAIRPDASKIDPDNKLLWRQRARRLESEAMRDGMLTVAGNLDTKMYGEAVQEETKSTGEIVPIGEDKGGRRSIYLLVRRSMPVNFLNAFDTPVMETNCTRRTVSTTAVQSLALMNSSFISSQALHFARRVLTDRPPRGGSAQPVDADSVALAYRLAFSRPPTPSERGLALDFLRDQLERYRKSGKTPQEVLESVYADLCQSLLSANEFAYVD